MHEFDVVPMTLEGFTEIRRFRESDDKNEREVDNVMLVVRFAQMSKVIDRLECLQMFNKFSEMDDFTTPAKSN